MLLLLGGAYLPADLTITIGGNAVIDYILHGSLGMRLNALDLVLVDPPVIPSIDDAVTVNDPAWSGTVVGVDRADHTTAGHTFVTITATNAAVASVDPAPFGLSDTPDGIATFAYRSLVVKRSKVDGVTDVRATCEVLEGGLLPGMVVELTSANDSFVAEEFSIGDVRIKWPTKDGPVFALDLGPPVVTLAAFVDEQAADYADSLFPITATQITDGAVTTPKLDANAVTTPKLAAGAVTANEIGAGAITTAKLNASAVIALVTNSGASVVIDAGGIAITDGALSIEDEFGRVVLGASGFSGSWADFIALGLYNARFSSGTAGSLAMGRTAALPYWTLAQTTGSPTATLVNASGSAYLEVGYAALNNLMTITSDAVPVRPNADYYIPMTYSCVQSGAAMNHELKVYVVWLDAAGSTISTDLIYSDNPSATTAPAAYYTPLFEAPDEANSAKLQVTIKEGTGHNAANKFRFWSLGLIPSQTVDLSGTLRKAIVDGLVITDDGAIRYSNDTDLPGSPSLGDVYLYDYPSSNYPIWVQWDGTRWKSCELFFAPFEWAGVAALASTATTGAIAAPNWAGDIWVEEVVTQFFVASGASALSGSHKWVGTHNKVVAANTNTTYGTSNIDSGSSGVWRTDVVAVGALLNNGTTHYALRTTWTKTGTPGALTAAGFVTYRLVVA